MTSSEWGRVGDDGTVYVRTADGERAVGQYPVGTPEEALKFYADRFPALETEVSLLDQRVRSGVLSPEEAAESVKLVRGQVVEANAVGDLASLAGRLDSLGRSSPSSARRARPRRRRRPPRRRPPRSSSSPRPRRSPPAPTGATAPTGCATSSTSGRRSPASTARPTTPCGSGSRPPARRTRGTARRTSPSRTSCARAPAPSRSGWPRRPRRSRPPPTGAPPPAATAT